MLVGECEKDAKTAYLLVRYIANRRKFNRIPIYS